MPLNKLASTDINIENLFKNRIVSIDDFDIIHQLNNEDIEDYYGQLSLSNVFDQKSNEDIYLDFKNPKTPDYRIQLSKITAQK